MKVKYTHTLLVLLLSILITGCNSNNPFKSNKNISQATGWKISTKDGGFKNKKSYIRPFKIYIAIKRLIIYLCNFDYNIKKHNIEEYIKLFL